MLAQPFDIPYIRLELALLATSRSVVLAFLVVFPYYDYGRIYFDNLYLQPLSSPTRRSWNPPLSTCFATAQFTRALLGRFA